MTGESKTKGIVQLKTDFRSLKYADASPYTAPLHTRDIDGDFASKTAIHPRQVKGNFLQQYRQYFKNESSSLLSGLAAQGHSRIDDVIRVAKFIGTPKGIVWEMHQAALNSSQISLNKSNRVPQGNPKESKSVWGAVKDAVKGVLENAGQTALSAVALTAGTLAQTAANGTGYHHDTYISRAYLVKGGKKNSLFAKIGNTALNTLGFAGDKIEGGAAVAAGARTLPKGNPAYSMLNEPSDRKTVSYDETKEYGSPDSKPYLAEPGSTEETLGTNRLLGNITVKTSTRFQGTGTKVGAGLLEIPEGSQVDTYDNVEDLQIAANTGKYNVVQEANIWYGEDYYKEDAGTKKALISSSVLSGPASSKTIDELKSGSYLKQVGNQKDLNNQGHPGFGNSRLGILADLLDQKAYSGDPGGDTLLVSSKKHDFVDRLGSDKDQQAGYQTKKYEYVAIPHSAVTKDGTPQRIADSAETTAFNGSVGKVLQAGSATDTRYGYSYLNELDGKDGDRSWVRKRLDTGVSDKIAGDEGRQKDFSEVPVEGDLSYKVSDDLSDKLSLIPFCITSINPDERTYLNFEANLESFDDSYSGNWSGTQYVGRGEQFYTYTGFSRDINFAFKVVARKADDLRHIYSKLNILCSSTAPTYDSGKYFMRGTLGSITIGDLISNQVGFFKSVKISWKTDYPWEIGNVHSSWRGQIGTEIIRVPHLLDVSVSFTPIHYFNVETADMSDRNRVYFGKKYKS